MTTQLIQIALAALATIGLTAGSSAQAQATIDQNKAVAGNVSPGDAPGFPITISQRGSYKLTGNLVVPAGVGGIVITASDVSIDLNGFVISGPITCSGYGATVTCSASNAALGIEALAGVTDVRVHHGSIEGFKLAALWLNERSTVEYIKSRNNFNYAAVVRADSRVSHSVFERNGTGGLFSEGGIVSDTIASGNGSYGIVVSSSGNSDGALVRHNVATHNGVAGISGQAIRLAFVDNQANKNPSNISYNPVSSALLPGNVCNGGPC